MNSFASLDLIEPLQRAVAAQNYETMTPIQAQAIPPLLEGRDVMGCAQTGTGKTAAFLLPIINHMCTRPTSGKRIIRGLVLTPTRELAAQIGESFDAYSHFVDLKHQVIFGGVNQRPQVAALRRGIDVLVATPGRLLDLHNQGHIDFNHVEFFVLDEADRMLDMGFIRDIRRVLEFLPKRRQNLLFSATMPDSIVKLAKAFLHQPIRVEVDRQSTTVERIVQQIMFVDRPNKKRLLTKVLKNPDVESAIVFTRTKHGANRVTQSLVKAGIDAAAIHGNKSQGARLRALAGFKAGDIRVLVATDIASRGIDVDGVSHVFNFDLPNISESYVHRIGRTGRAGREGTAISFCDESETEYLRDIEDLIGQSLDVVLDHQWHHAAAVPQPRQAGQRRGAPKRKAPSHRKRQGQSHRNSRGGHQQRTSQQSGSTQGSSQGGGSGEAPPAARQRRRKHWRNNQS